MSNKPHFFNTALLRTLALMALLCGVGSQAQSLEPDDKEGVEIDQRYVSPSEMQAFLASGSIGLQSHQLLEVYAAYQRPDIVMVAINVNTPIMLEEGIGYLLIRDTVSGQWNRYQIDSTDWESVVEPFFRDAGLPIADQLNGTIDSLTAAQEAAQLAQSSSHTGTQIRDVIVNGPVSTGADLAVGHLAGEFAVGQSGEANYQIPIPSPRGVAGMAPNLALIYNSRAGQGQFGKGWSMSGLSAISRCGKTLATDGMVRPVSYNDDDAYCLDGQRLIKTSAAGASIEEYRTEIESFQKIRTHRTADTTGVTYWEVTDKSGQKRYYGSFSSGRALLADTDIVSTWLISKQKDLFNNTINYLYLNDTGAGKAGGYAIHRIYWQNSSGHKVGMIEVKNDQNRPDKRAGFGASGNKVTSRYRANAIEILSRPNIAGTSLDSLETSAVIKLNYDDATAKPDDGSYLKSAEQCAANGLTCLAPTEFDYDYGDQWFGTNYAESLGSSDHQVFADVTGDGRPDFVYADNNYLKVKVSGRPGVVNTGRYVYGFQTESKYIRVMDVNGDGLQDLLLAQTSNGSRSFKVFKAYLTANGDPAFSSPVNGGNLGSTAPSDFYKHHHFVFDVDNDGLPEVFAKRGGKLWYFKNNNGVLNTHPSGTLLTVSDEQVITPLEYDGDGIPELLVNLDGCSSGGGGGGGGPGGTILYREDGVNPLGDLVVQDQSAGSTLSTSSCDQTMGILKWNFDTQALEPVVMGGEVFSTAGVGGENNYNQLLDFNGDGLTDLAVAPHSNTAPLNKWRFFVNQGGGWYLAAEAAVGSDGSDKVAQFDYDGDGIQELMLGRNGKWHRFNIDITRYNTQDNYSVSLVNTFRDYEGDSGYFMDWNGDGLQDYVSVDNGDYHIKTHKGSKHGLLMHVRNGLGDDTHISYVALSMGAESVVYNGPTGTPSFPVRHFQAPYYLVRSFAADTGRQLPGGADIKMVTNYTYGGAKFHQQGRGFLGFEHIEAHNVNSQIVTHNYHRQDFPYTGMVSRSEQWTPELQFSEVNWNDISDEFEPCDGSSGDPCVQPRSADSGKGKPGVVMQRNQTAAGDKLMETVNTFDLIQLGSTSNNTDRYFPFIDVSTEKSFSFGTATDTVIKRTVTDTDYSSWGNATGISVVVDDGNGQDVHRVTTTNTYDNFTADWCLGRLRTSSVVHERAVDNAANTASITETRSSEFTYNSATCTLATEVTEPGDPDWSLTKTYGYDAFGNRVTETVSGPGIDTRTTTTGFDAYGHFPVTAVNDLGHTATTGWDERLGVKLWSRDANGITTSFQHDEFGRVTRAQSPYQAMYTTTSYQWCTPSNCANEWAVYRVSETSSAITHADKTTRIIEFDSLGREIHTRTRAFDGTYVHTQAVFDIAGRALATSNPYYETDPSICWTVNVHDVLGRITDEYKAVDEIQCNPVATSYVPRLSALGPIVSNYSGHTTYDFDGLTTTVTDPQGRQITRTTNVMDRLRFITEFDNDGSQIATEYGYDAVGNMTWVKDDAGNVSTMAFNIRGFKESMNDPDMGFWEYEYNTLGELKRQEDAKGQVSNMTYDTLGRMLTRVEPEGTTTYYYDEAGTSWDPDYYGKSVGKLTSLSNTGDSSYNWERLIYRGDAGEMTMKIDYLDGKGYANYFYYDDLGRKYRHFMPTSHSSITNYWGAENRLELRTYFNQFGFEHKILDHSYAHGNVPATEYWQGLETDAFGNFVNFKLNDQALPVTRTYDRATGAISHNNGGVNGQFVSQEYEWDAVGNLTERRDLVQDWKESFDYDDLYRLEQVNFHPTLGGGSVDVRGRYKYDSIGNILCKDADSVSGTCSGGYRNYQYGSGNTSSAGTAGPHAVTSVDVGSNTRTYSYDNNGNLTTVSGDGATRNLTWTSFNKVKTISVTGESSTTLFYRPDRSRYKQIVIKDGVTTTTNYAGDYERRNTDGVIKHVYYIRAGGEVVSQVTRNDGEATPIIGSETVQYFLRDHQASIVATISSGGQLLEEMSYDAFGKRRSPVAMDFTNPNVYLTSATSTRGYTGHEHLDHIGLINMNGRIYDAELGRFLSADPFVQYPESTQGFNRYTYVQNNPLSYSDPSGFFLKALGAKIAGMVVTALTGQAWLGQLVQGYLSSGGDLKAALIGQFIGVLPDGWSTVASFVNSGIQARNSGGKFIDGIKSAARNMAIGFGQKVAQNYLGNAIDRLGRKNIDEVEKSREGGGAVGDVGVDGSLYGSGSLSFGSEAEDSSAFERTVLKMDRELSDKSKVDAYKKENIRFDSNGNKISGPGVWVRVDVTQVTDENGLMILANRLAKVDKGQGMIFVTPGDLEGTTRTSTYEWQELTEDQYYDRIYSSHQSLYRNNTYGETRTIESVFGPSSGPAYHAQGPRPQVWNPEYGRVIYKWPE